jgi:carboxyl-terminal processing protease
MRTNQRLTFFKRIMKNTALVIGAIVLIGGLAAAYYPKPYNEGEKEQAIIQTMLSGLRALHYDPQQLDDDFSKKMFALHLERIDYYKRLFTQDDVAKLKKYETRLDDETENSNFEYFDLSTTMADEALLKTQAIYRDLLAKPMDLEKNETFEFDPKKRTFAKDDAELREIWRKTIKYDLVNRISDKLEEQEKVDEKSDKQNADNPQASTDKKVEPKVKKTVIEIEKEAREKILKEFDDYYKRMLRAKRMDKLSDYLNCMTSIFDPHTNYFEPKDKEKFNQDMSGRFEGIGARLQAEGDYTKVNEIIPGGPAYKQKELEPKDIILKVAQGDAEPVDAVGMDMDDVVKMIKGKKNTEVRLTVKKNADGSTKVIKIIRDEVILDEGFAKSLLLDTKAGGDKIGYIKLPRFYADFEDRNGRFCSKDVATEVEKLKKENVKGIIIDLRNNGGGSLRDVVDMSGLFVPSGPMVQVKGRDANPEIYPDADPRVQYDGPLVVLVNGNSASASEILAAAMQDYSRAVIVGSKSTYGKGTVQRFFDLDRGLSGNNELKPLGEVKVTIQKFYRVNGGSTQLRGVVPDIILPDNYNYLKYGEQENDYPMPWTEIKPATYTKTNSIKDMDKLRKLSESRVKKNETFGLLEENAKRFKRQRDETIVPIGLKEFRAYDSKNNNEAKKYENMFKNIEDINATNPSLDMPQISADSTHIGRNNEWIKGVKKDIQLYETLNIMHDLIHQ